MEKKNFVSMIMGTIGGVLFALGMCMCLLTEWGAFAQGVVVSAVGLAVLVAMLMVRRTMEGKSMIARPGVRTVGATLLGVAGVLVLGTGMCMTMLWGAALLVPGIVVGLLGIVMLLCLIPVCKGIR
ncbi:hypothetical protein [Bifidobacterium sp. UBA4282]|uniref:hypothetical protein n=1 Tax=Bifidobacterium sp. UBA4282 TaxID=1946096 RepID=UPI0025B92240|nr:hypothetical protein [Bifidobacterium sp. UBA4282]